ncbi:MAG: 50S ribosomal protein L4 [Nitrosopumilus sp.]
MMKIASYKTNGTKEEEVELPLVFSTPFRRELIHKAYTNLNSHQFQRQGRKPNAGMDVVADSNDPPTGQGVSRVARAQGGGGGRQGQGAEVASTRGGRQAHPPIVEKGIYKKLNKKEKKLALCSAIAATASKELVESRGHKVEGIESFPIIVSDDIETVSKASEIVKILDSLKLTQDIERLESRKSRSGKPSLRGRSKKVGKSILFVTKNSSNIRKAIGSLPGVEAKNINELSVLDLAPGSDPIRLTVYSKSAIEEIRKIKSTHLEVMAKTQ